MKNIYVLKIWYDLTSIGEKISEVFNIIRLNCPWNLVLVEKQEDPPIDFINYFLNLLEDKYERLQEIGIPKNYISIWRYYYCDEDQCNLEITPQEMSRLGKNGIVLCITCCAGEDSPADEIVLINYDFDHLKDGSIKDKILRDVRNLGIDYKELLGANPDIKIQREEIILIGQGHYKGKSKQTNLKLSPYLPKGEQ